MGYPSDLTTKQWNQIKHFFENENHGKHFQTQKKRKLVNAVLYLNKTGCQWRMLPKDLPKWSTVSSFYNRAKKSGLWELVNDELVGKTRVKAGRASTPSYSLIDSQSVKTTGKSEEVGIDGGKKVKGRKKHIVTDIMGNLLKVKVHTANIHDTVGGGNVFVGAIKNIRKSRVAVLTGVTAKPLKTSSCRWVKPSKYLKKSSRKAGRFYLSVGLSSVLLLGLTTLAGFPKTMKSPPNLLKICLLFPISTRF